jgi:two-component system chemotaxis response regulator CheY
MATKGKSSARKPAARKAGRGPAAAKKSAKTCLIVDDSRVVRKMAHLLLEEMGFKCSDAENGREALTACQGGMPDAILLDWVMPVMNGLEFIKALRALDGGKAPKVIFCTTLNEVPNIQDALNAGADEYIMKPFDADVMRSKFELVGLLP